MELQSLTYTSRAAEGLKSSDVDQILASARTYNPLDGITGILLYNGDSFMQMLEGAESALDDLLVRLQRDKRHHSFEIRDRRPIERRFFPQWSMHRLDVPQSHHEGMARVEAELGSRLDNDMKQVVDQSLGAISQD